MERLDAIAAIEVARSQHWLAKTEMGYSVTRLEDVTAVLRDKRFHSGLSILTQMNGLPAGYTQTRRQSILSMEGDGHARLRRLVAPAFTPASASRLRPTMRAVVNDLFDKVAADGHCEFVTAGRKLPESAAGRAGVKEVGGLPARHYEPFAQPGCLVSSTSDCRCSSVWVTRSTSSMVVLAALTFFQPSLRKVLMPFSIDLAAITEELARVMMSERISSSMKSNS